MPDQSKDNFLTVAAVCKRLSLGTTTVWRMSRDGDMPAPVNLNSRTTRWRESEIDSFVAGTWESDA